MQNPISEVAALLGAVDLLLCDQTTGGNIIWADVARSDPTAPIEHDDAILIEPRFMKERERQSKRTRELAEVFTPHNVCDRQNEMIVESWINRPWEEFLDATFLEIACGEAPYIVSRYDVVDGKPLEIGERIGLLDRKLRLVNQHCDEPERWIESARRAFQSVYGYEFQGDNLLIARCNLLLSAVEYHREKFRAEPSYKFLLELVDIINWNFWQFDGFNNCLPFSAQGGLFNECRIKNWSTGETVPFP